MKLSTVMDFPDDCLEHVYTPEMADELCRLFTSYGVDRLYFQYYGNYEDEWCMNCDEIGREINRKTAELMPNYSRVFVEAAKKYGMETAAVMRPQEQGLFIVTSPYHTRGLQSGVPHLGGKILGHSKFLREHPELRIKRRTYDFDPQAASKIIGTIKLYKQNAVESRITKETLTIYTSPDNSCYTPYRGDYSFSWSTEPAGEEVTVITRKPDYETETLTRKGDPIRVLTLSGLHITDQFVAIGVRCAGECGKDEHFTTLAVRGIACFEKDGTPICASPGHGDRYPWKSGATFLEGGFYFDDGFGASYPTTLDPADKEGFLAIAKGKNLYNHGALCECEPLVQEFWLKQVEQALEDGYDFFGNRIENHSVHVDEPFAYGYNDCIKEEYFRRYGVCSEEEMDLSKIARIRGDAYTKIFVEAARQVRAKGKKVYLTLNIEMLQVPIPLERRFAYPMNVEWQWERWLEEIQPDEINFRMFHNTIDFFLNNPQCRHMIDVAKSYHVPLTVERYTMFDFLGEYETLKATGLFERMALYETADVFHPDGKGGLELTERGQRLLPGCKKLLEQANTK